jgi:general secretion pathway protein C
MSFGEKMNLSRAITIFNLVVIALIAYFCVGIFYQFAGAQIIPTDNVSVATTNSAPARVPENHQSLSNYRPVLDRDLFDTVKIPQAPPKEEDLNVAELEETELNLKLWGTVSGIDERAYAVIEDIQKREQNLYRTGDTIQNATVKKIMREKVVLNREGKDEILAMEKLEQGGSGRSSSRRASVRSSRASSSASRTPRRRTQRVSLRREMINESMQDISKLMTQIAVRPHMEDGQAAGLALSNIKPNSIFRRMGLRNGDILQGIDGQEIQTVDDALKLYQNLQNADGVEVQLKRRGQERTINYNIR